MARILYGIMGDARGHLSRSLSVVQHMPGHEFLFAGGGTVLELREQGYEVVELPMLATLYRNNTVHFTATVSNALSLLARKGKVISRLCEIIEDFRPDLILSDYEFFVPLAARRLGRPCLSLDHQHVLTHCAYQPPPREKLNRLLTFLPINFLYSNATRFLISSFYELPPKNPHTTELAPPILRKSVREHSASHGEHVLVYISGGAYKALIPSLESLQRECYVYGFGDMPAQGRITFKPKSEHGFLQDLASCSYVISNGGHNLISEALYYGKPVVSLPIQFLYEQFLNGYFLKQLGFGEYCMQTSSIDQVLQNMEYMRETYVKRIQQNNFWGNDHVVSRLESLLQQGFTGPAP